MKTLPSKELLSEVLGVNVTEVYKRKGEIRFKTHTNRADGWSTSDTPIPNIAELALIKCKHWALSKGFYISSEYHILEMKDGTKHPYGVAKAYQGWKRGKKHREHGDDEVDAIIKVCEWIREYLKDKA